MVPLVIINSTQCHFNVVSLFDSDVFYLSVRPQSRVCQYCETANVAQHEKLFTPQTAACVFEARSVKCDLV